MFDEVKIGLKVHYHAKTGKLVGLAMSSDELGSLHDVYQTLQPDHKTQKASYILQYLWRCTASNFDILGPYYSCAGGAKAKYILSTLYNTIHIGFATKVKVIKMLTGCGSGAYGNKPLRSSVDIHEVQAWFTNPYTNNKVFTIVCPSHQVCTLYVMRFSLKLVIPCSLCISLDVNLFAPQLKNMVSALYSSKVERTKRFKCEGVEFGWSCIEDMFERDVQRAKAGLPRRVPSAKAMCTGTYGPD